jgi:hypothetical protein
MATEYQEKSGRSIPGFPKKWTFGFQLIVLLLIIGLIGAGVYFGYPYLNKASKGNKADLRAGFNNFVGFAPGINMNGGAAPNKNSRMYKEFGLTFEAVRMDDKTGIWILFLPRPIFHRLEWIAPATLPRCRLCSF